MSDSLNPKDAAGKAKPQMSLIPHGALVEVARVMEVGAAKYGPYNWRHTPIGYMAYLNATERHRGAFQEGQDQDVETKRSHLAHIAATALILLDAIITGNAKDDRPPKNPAYVEPEPVPVFPLSDAGWTPKGACPCPSCRAIRGELRRYGWSAAKEPGDGAAQDRPGPGKPATP